MSWHNKSHDISSTDIIIVELVQHSTKSQKAMNAWQNTQKVIDIRE